MSVGAREPFERTLATSEEVEPFLPLTRPSLSKEAIQEVVACLESGWLTAGPRVQEFEKNLQEFFGTPYVLSFNSATAAMFAALKGMGIGEGDEVITTPFTFVATLQAIMLCGARPVLVDVDASTYNMKLDHLENVITPQTKAILPVHFAGLPVDLDPLYALADEHGLRVVEDAAHGIGASYKGQLIGTFGDSQAFSFHANKNMTTGEGGCLVTRDPEVFRRAECLRFRGLDRPAWDRFSEKGSQHYDIIDLSFKLNMMDIQAALGLHQLPDLERLNDLRRQRAEQYLDELQPLEKEGWLTLPPGGDEVFGHCWHLFAPLLHQEAISLSRDSVLEVMKTKHRIGCGLHYLPCHLFTYFRETFAYKEGDFPVTEHLGGNVLSLPLFPDLKADDVSRVVRALTSVCEEASSS